MIPNPFKTGGKASEDRPQLVPEVFTMASGSPDNDKRDLINAMVVDWQVDLRMSKPPKPPKTCPFYSPTSQNIQIRTFFAHMKKHYNWQYTDNDFKGFKGSLNSVMSALYKERYELYVSTNLVFLTYFWNRFSCPLLY